MIDISSSVDANRVDCSLKQEGIVVIYSESNSFEFEAHRLKVGSLQRRVL